jgi:hypothetical protein
MNVNTHQKTQSLRRHHRARLIRKRRDYWNTAVEHKTLGKLDKTPTPCSCHMCGNPRRHTGRPTLQEIRANTDTLEQSADPELPENLPPICHINHLKPEW